RAPRARRAITKPAALYSRRNDGGAGRGGYHAACRADEPSTWDREARLSGSKHGLLSLKAPDFSPGDVYRGKCYPPGPAAANVAPGQGGALGEGRDPPRRRKSISLLADLHTIYGHFPEV